MPQVKFTQALKRFYPGLEPMEITATTLPEILKILDQHHNGLRAYLLDDQGSLRKHVNIFIDGNLLQDRKGLSDPVAAGSEIYIMQALSGG